MKAGLTSGFFVSNAAGTRPVAASAHREWLCIILSKSFTPLSYAIQFLITKLYKKLKQQQETKNINRVTVSFFRIGPFRIFKVTGSLM
ncbi:MAG TPA: hypothetical protein VIJ92_01900 [Ginsengibacter sp.]